MNQGDLGDRRRQHGEAALDVCDPLGGAGRDRAQLILDTLDLAPVTEQPPEQDGNNERSQHEQADQRGGGPPTC